MLARVASVARMERSVTWDPACAEIPSRISLRSIQATDASQGGSMRPHLALTAFGVLVAGQAVALDLPARKAGLWELQMNFENRNLPAQTMQHCIDAETDKLMNSMGGTMRSDM